MTLRWRKSSHSGSGPACIEIASGLAHVRDSKNPTGPVLHADLTVLVTKVKAGDFHR